MSSEAAPPPAPRATGRTKFCPSQQPTDGGRYPWLCTGADGHEPLDHAAHRGDGTPFARWPASGGTR